MDAGEGRRRRPAQRGEPSPSWSPFPPQGAQGRFSGLLRGLCMTGLSALVSPSPPDFSGAGSNPLPSREGERKRTEADVGAAHPRRPPVQYFGEGTPLPKPRDKYETHPPSFIDISKMHCIFDMSLPRGMPGKDVLGKGRSRVREGRLRILAGHRNDRREDGGWLWRDAVGGQGMGRRPAHTPRGTRGMLKRASA